MPSEDTPIGTDENSNQLIKYGKIKNFTFEPNQRCFRL